MAVSPAQLLADQIERLLNGDAWHGPNLEQLLEGLTPQMAAHRPPGSAHAIQDLLAHLDAWHGELLAVVNGRAYRTMPEHEQWPGVRGRDEDAFRRVAESTFEHSRRLVEAVARLDDAALDRPMEERDYTLRELLHGFAQHTAYHLGQIALLKRLINA